MAEKKKYNSILVSGRKDETLTYSKYVKDEETAESVKESLDKKVNVTDELTTQQIKDGAITNEKMAADSVGNTNLQDGSVSNEKLEDGSITNEKLAENSITKDKLKDNTIGVEKLDPELRQTINAATGLPENLVETIQNVDDTLKDHQSQLDDKQSQIDDKQQQITANDEDISLLQTRSTQMEETINSIAATGGASQATAVTYNNEKSKLTAVNIQSAVDEVVDKVSIKDEEGTVVETPFRYIQSEEFIFAKVDVNDRLLFGIQWDGTPKFGKTSAVEDRLQSQVTLLAERVATIMGDEDTTNVIDTMNELKKFFAEIENTETLTSILANLDNVEKNLDKTTIKDEEGNVQDTPFRVIENEEFIMAVVDSESKVLFGIYRATGKPYYPQNDMYHISQSEEFIWVILDAENHPLLGIQQDGTCWAAKAQWIDGIKAIKEALSSIDETLKTFQPKEDGKGLINLDVADSFFYISNDEYIIAVVDSESRILAGIKYDGEPYFPNNEMYSVITNDEWLYAILDAENKVLGGFRADDGHMVVGGIDISTFIANAIIDIQDIKERTAHLSTIVNDEYLAVEQDAEGKILSSTNHDGSKTFYTPMIPKSSIKFDDRTIYEDEVEDYKELLLDSDNKILLYTDKNGVVHENREIVFSSANLGSNESEKELTVPRSMNLPKYGYTDIKEETFYLTANEGYSDKNGILAMLVNEDTQANAQKGLTPYKYFVKSTLQNTDGVYSVTSESVSLNFYVPSDVKEVGGKSYVTSSLTKGSDGSYTVNPNSIEVTKIVDKPNVGTWEISKKTKHWCVVDIDFGSYLKGTYNVLVSFQGASTLYNRQKNFRYAFVKADYKSKVKLKIGELLKVDKFNLKSYYSDDTKLKEPIIFRLYLQAKELHKFNEQYPWSSSSIIATGATGIIKSFPVCTSVGGEFYGVQFFGYKKDKANYMLSGDEDGMIISGGVGCNWAEFDWSTWEDEMNDDPTESNRIAVEKFYQFINGNDFTKENAPKHMNINDWIDYFIFIQLFRLRDNDIHNLILYSGADKKIFSPFLYDLDLSFFVYSFNLEADPTNTVWLKLKSLYWEEICARYKELRSSVLTQGNFNMIVSDLQSSIDYSDFEKGVKKWGKRDTKVTTGYLEELFGELLKTFDVYFNLNK